MDFYELSEGVTKPAEAQKGEKETEENDSE